MSNKTHGKPPEETGSAPKQPSFSRISYFVFGFLVLVIFGYVLFVNLSNNTDILIAPAGKIKVEMADSQAERTLGLSGRESITDDQGLLFVFEESSDRNCFWMKDMRFSIDMIWMNDEKEVVTIAENVSPQTYPETFCPVSPAKYGLELSSGNANSLQIVTGSKLRW